MSSLSSVVEVLGDDLLGAGEALGVGVGLAVVGNDAVEASVAGGLEELDGDVAGAKDVEQRHGQHGLDEDFERAAANQAGVVFGILIEIEREGARLFACDDFARGLPDFGLDAAAADGAGDGAVVADEHFGALEGGDGAARVHDGGHSAAAALALQLHDLLIDIHLLRLLDWTRSKSIRGDRVGIEQAGHAFLAAKPRECYCRMASFELISKTHTFFAWR